MKRMKSLSLMLLLSISFGVGAQNMASENPNEFRLGVGLPTVYNNGLALNMCKCGKILGHGYDGSYDGIYDGPHYVTPTIEMSYFYRFNNWFSLGGTFTYMGLYKHTYLVYDQTQHSKEGYNSFALAPRVRFDWYRSRYVNLYSSVGAGFVINQWYKHVKSTGYNDSDLEYWFTLDITPIGVKIGRAHV